jgi:hypothetical protein
MFKSVATVARFQKLPGRVDEPDMAERLRGVAKELPADWIDPLGQQAELIDEGGGTLENGSSAATPWELDGEFKWTKG